MRCCGTPFQTITVGAGTGALSLLRCAVCEEQRWARGEQLLDRTTAFAELATAYREVPLRARAARDRAATVSAARRAARVAAQAARPEPVVPASTTPDARELRSLLAGWQVLGAAS